MLNSVVCPITTNKTLGIKDSVFRVCSKLVLSSITNKTFIISSEGNIRGSDTVSLIIRDDFNTAIFEHTHTGRNSIFVQYEQSKRFDNTYQEYVVPKSMPITVPMSLFFSFSSLATTRAPRAKVSNRNCPPNLIFSLLQGVVLKNLSSEIKKETTSALWTNVVRWMNCSKTTDSRRGNNLWEKNALIYSTKNSTSTRNQNYMRKKDLLKR